MERKWLIGILIILLVAVEFGCAGRRGARRKGGEPTEEDVAGWEVPPIRVEEIDFYEESALKDVHFEYDKSSLLSPEKEILKENAAWLRAHRKAKALIEGHCDERGTQEYNLALGERRALSVRNYLIFLGIDSQRLLTISYGEERPLDPGNNEEAWRKNRRAHLKVSR
ncbi:Peptidoglycan-associated lipoprotein [subsurface metagenome]